MKGLKFPGLSLDVHPLAQFLNTPLLAQLHPSFWKKCCQIFRKNLCHFKTKYKMAVY